MKRKVLTVAIKTLAMAIGVAILSGCASAYIQNFKRITPEPNRYYSSAHAKCTEDPKSLELEAIINDKLKRKNIFGKELIIQCRINHFSDGSRFSRALLGALGSDKASSLSSFTISTSNAKEILSFEVSSELRTGVLGGNPSAMLEQSAIQVIEYVTKNLLHQ